VTEEPEFLKSTTSWIFTAIRSSATAVTKASATTAF